MQSDDFKQNPDQDAFKRLLDVQRVSQMLFEREAGRLARKYGLADPRTQRIISTAGGARTVLTALEIADEARPVEVKPAQDEAVVYGRVASDDRRGVADTEIVLEDTNGRVMRAAGSARTDANGRFELHIAPEVAARLAGKEVVITARNARGDLVYRAPTTVSLEANKAVSADLNIGVRPPLHRPSSRPRRPEPATSEKVIFAVRGQVVTARGKPVPRVLVRVYDKDRRYDDLLGAALTNQQGEFSITYRKQDFSEGETAADLYFVVIDANEKELLSTADKVIFNAERETTVTLTI